MSGVIEGFDYKSLTDVGCNPLDVLDSVVTQDNVTVIAKLAPHIPNQVFCCKMLLSLFVNVAFFLNTKVSKTYDAVQYCCCVKCWSVILLWNSSAIILNFISTTSKRVVLWWYRMVAAYNRVIFIVSGVLKCSLKVHRRRNPMIIRYADIAAFKILILLYFIKNINECIRKICIIIKTYNQHDYYHYILYHVRVIFACCKITLVNIIFTFRLQWLLCISCT